MDSQNAKAYLIPYPVESFSKPILIDSEMTYIGRDADGIQVADRLVSRRHSLIKSENGRFRIADLESQNGTFLNDERIQEAPLSNHDKITIGHRTFLFLLQPCDIDPSLEKPSSDTADTIAISHEEIDLSHLWAQNAKNAARGFLRQAISTTPDAQPPDNAAHRRLSLLYQLSENLRATRAVEAIYAQGLKLLLKAIPAIDCALVVLKSTTDEAYQITSINYRDGQPIDADAIPMSRTLFDWVFSEKVTLVSQDVGQDDRFQDSDSIRLYDLRSIVCVPLIGKDKVLGLLYAQSNRLLSPITRQDAIFASAVANELALNIDHIQLQAKVLQHERMAAIGLTVSNLAHNIKNLIAINQGAGQMMDSLIKGLDNPQIEKNWDWVQESFAGINRLSTGMLEYVKEDALLAKPVDINRSIRKYRNSIESSLSRNGLVFEWILTEKNPIWLTDEVQFQRALLNLVINAADAVKERQEGRIRIRTSLERKQILVVSVLDNGCGISPRKKGRVLDLFYTTKGTKGTGLGLPMVQKFVDKSGGRLKFRSKEGIGTVFTMLFPRM
jgi:signal transduction histidine kinase/pSer/pThr/pTyr-binding forkhead associated (FHA) protein